VVNSFLFRKHRLVFLAILFLAIIRLVFFSATILSPIENEVGKPVSPLVESGTDLLYYQNMAARLVETDVSTIIGQYLHFYRDLNFLGETTDGAHATLYDIRRQANGILKYLNVGPAFPTLLHISSYGPGNTLPLAIFFLLISICGCIAWLFWLRAAGLAPVWLMLFGLLPAPLYFTISLGTDLPFMFATGIFFCAYTSNRWRSINILAWFSAILLMALLRPTALSILSFVIIDILAQKNTSKTLGIRLGVGAAIVCLFSLTLAYYFPHGVHVIGTTTQLVYFGSTVGEYYGGLLPTLPDFLNKSGSLVLLIGAKALYFVGLRPSFGDTAIWIVLLRAAPGLVLLPGLAWGLTMLGWRMRLFLVLYLIPIIAGPAQDRYSLPIQPILLLCCACACSRLIMVFLTHKPGTFDRLPNTLRKWLKYLVFKPTLGL
jgi:hypothetical protein